MVAGSLLASIPGQAQAPRPSVALDDGGCMQVLAEKDTCLLRGVGNRASLERSGEICKAFSETELNQFGLL